MNEIAPGLWHWTARHEHIGSEVSSYYLLPERVLIDPMVPADGIAWFQEHGSPEHGSPEHGSPEHGSPEHGSPDHGPPEHVLLTNRHHDRHAWRLQEAFGCSVHCIRNGLYELDGRGPVEAFDFGDRLPGGVVVHEVDAICPDETALHLERYRALACADGVIGSGREGQLAFVPDSLMDDPEQTKQQLRAAYRRLLELDFDLLLLAHGKPLVSDGKEALRRFVSDAV